MTLGAAGSRSDPGRHHDDGMHGHHDHDAVTTPVATAVDESRHALVRLGGAFMQSPQIVEASGQLGVTPQALYFQGRAGAMGLLTTTSVLRLFGSFAPRAVEASLGDGRTRIPPAAAAAAFADVAARWGEVRLGEVPDADLTRLADLSEAVVDGTAADALPLVAAWREQPRPTAPAARAVHAAFLLRELRGGLHFAALSLQGLFVVQAVLADPESGTARLRFFGWRDDEIAELGAAMDADDRRARWDTAEADTGRAVTSRMVSALGEAGVADLARLVQESWAATRTTGHRRAEGQVSAR